MKELLATMINPKAGIMPSQEGHRAHKAASTGKCITISHLDTQDKSKKAHKHFSNVRRLNLFPCDFGSATDTFQLEVSHQHFREYVVQLNQLPYPQKGRVKS